MRAEAGAGPGSCLQFDCRCSFRCSCPSLSQQMRVYSAVVRRLCHSPSDPPSCPGPTGTYIVITASLTLCCTGHPVTFLYPPAGTSDPFPSLTQRPGLPPTATPGALGLWDTVAVSFVRLFCFRFYARVRSYGGRLSSPYCPRRDAPRSPHAGADGEMAVWLRPIALTHVPHLLGPFAL